MACYTGTMVQILSLDVRTYLNSGDDTQFALEKARACLNSFLECPRGRGKPSSDTTKTEVTEDEGSVRGTEEKASK